MATALCAKGTSSRLISKTAVASPTAAFSRSGEEIMTTSIEHPDGITCRVEVMDALSRYPEINHEELSWLLRWFRKEASAMDVAMLASDPTLAGPYKRFKAEHLDRLSTTELFWGAVLLVLALAVLVMVV
jgi:hypothetical protein